jgi:hypothetical protein
MTEKVVADDVLGKFARQQNDWFRRVREGSLDPEEVGRAVQNVIDRGHYFTYDRRKDGWELVEDVGFAPPFDISKMELVSFLKNGENYINGEEMVRRGRTELKVNLGQRHAEYLLEHQNEIPKEFRKFYPVFTGTIWRCPDGNRRVACLYWDGRQWVLSFRWLGDDWRSYARLPRLRE